MAERLSMLGGRLVSLMQETEGRPGLAVRLLLLSNSRNPGGGWLDHAEHELARFLRPAARRPLLFFPFAAVRMSFDA